MKIGLTYDLRDEYLAAGYGEEETAEFDRAETIDEIEAALVKIGHQTDRIGNVRRLVPRLANGERWDLVFNIAEGLSGYGREAQVPAILEAYDIPYTFSDPLVSALALHKGMTKRVLRDLGVPTAPFCEVARPSDIERVDLPFPLFIKPIAEGTAKGIDDQSKVDDRKQLERACRRVLDTFHQPALVESYLGGREFTVGIVGTGDDAVAVGTMEIELLADAQAHSYTYVNKEQCEQLCRFPLAPESWAHQAEQIALAAWRGLNCRDGGRVDLRAALDTPRAAGAAPVAGRRAGEARNGESRGDEEDRLFVMEINPLPGLHPSHSDLPMVCTAMGMPYVELIRRIVTSAQRRMDTRRGGGNVSAGRPVCIP